MRPRPPQPPSPAPLPQAPALQSADHFDLLSHWHIQAPLEQVWATLTDTEGWPHWWPQVREVRTLRAGGLLGLGSVRRIRWATRLPHQISVEIELVEVLRLQRIRGRSRGQLQGEGIWLLSADGDSTHLTYLWRVRLNTAWMRWLAPLLAPLFRWNHESVMRAGEAGLQRWLAPHSLR
ncbi:SRPBCC family protein [Paucibacter sp. APW11]|uniref:SRPBCC family protein n=1 Tax=Roseateles aquae TaxID=3077235 RepID=A0ABU3PF09_9BURK|nr:SRPBCC family protein [Paucibacter sp. APW11]MDT9000742.1 SRPBCC family protein [Paucibacter sp. APW11]